ncbi:uncharacterized protein BDV14DRAFT_173556 [Aspergillus stella-maris]|uniref:uncharacterized protein n=1 Tax=Aspergillus stella-maris TaxID=1810926 RepID=UPI003CCDFE78
MTSIDLVEPFWGCPTSKAKSVSYHTLPVLRMVFRFTHANQTTTVRSFCETNYGVSRYIAELMNSLTNVVCQ